MLSEIRSVAALVIVLALFMPSALVRSGEEVAMNHPGLTLRETFDLYVRSIDQADLDALFSTVTDGDDFFFLNPKGEILDRDEYYKYHQDWFASSDWEMPVELLTVREEGEFGYTNAIFYYRQDLPDGGRYNLDSYFVLVFRKEDGMWKVVADVCTPIKRYFCEADPEITYDFDQEFLFRMIEQRRTVRKYKNTPVPDEHVKKILDAARYAPTAGNQQPWKFLVVRDRKKLNLLRDMALVWWSDDYKNHYDPDPETLETAVSTVQEALDDAFSAPVYVAVLVDSEAKYAEYIFQDGALAVGNLMIAARALGYGTGYFTTFFPEDRVKDFFSIPDRYKLICFTPVGVPFEWPETPEKKDLDGFVVYEQF